MSEDSTTYLSQPSGPPALAKRLSAPIAGAVGLAIGAILGAGGVLITHSTSTAAPAGQMGNVNGGGPGGGPPGNGAAPTASPS